MTSKRRASTGLSSSLSSSPPQKAHRPSSSPPPTDPSQSNPDSESSVPLIHQCTLPPTCQPPINTPTALPSTAALERHYATYHTHVCEEGACRAVFPEAWFLELHQTECHDPLAAVRKERGDKIFACFLPTCPKHFSTPKTRRMHLLQAHAYPKQYFYNITNYGVGGLLRKYGEGASLIRPDWKPRDTKKDDNEDDAMDDDSDEEKDEDVKPTPPPSKAKAARDAPPHLRPTPQSKEGKENVGDVDVEKLANNLESMQLDLVPPTVHFGRGASHGGFKAGSTSARGRGRGRGRGGYRGAKSGHRAKSSQDRTGDHSKDAEKAGEDGEEMDAEEEHDSEEHAKGEEEAKEIRLVEPERDEAVAFVPVQVRSAKKGAMNIYHTGKQQAAGKREEKK